MLLWYIAIGLMAFWLLGLIFKIGGKFVHALLVIALIVFIVRFFVK